MAQTSLEEALDVATSEGMVLVEILTREQKARFAVQKTILIKPSSFCKTRSVRNGQPWMNLTAEGVKA
jgi:hypothetical protein